MKKRICVWNYSSEVSRIKNILREFSLPLDNNVLLLWQNDATHYHINIFSVSKKLEAFGIFSFWCQSRNACHSFAGSWDRDRNKYITIMLWTLLYADCSLFIAIQQPHPKEWDWRRIKNTKKKRCECRRDLPLISFVSEDAAESSQSSRVRDDLLWSATREPRRAARRQTSDGGIHTCASARTVVCCSSACRAACWWSCAPED